MSDLKLIYPGTIIEFSEEFINKRDIGRYGLITSSCNISVNINGKFGTLIAADVSSSVIKVYPVDTKIKFVVGFPGTIVPDDEISAAIGVTSSNSIVLRPEDGLFTGINLPLYTPFSRIVVTEIISDITGEITTTTDKLNKFLN